MEAFRAFLQCHGRTPYLVKDSSHLLIIIGVIFLKGNKIKGGWWRSRA